MWRDHDPRGWAKACGDAAAEEKPIKKLRLAAYDLDSSRLAETEKHLGLFGWDGLATIERGDARQFSPKPEWNATVVANMPHGERIGDNVEALHGDFGARLQRLEGYSAALLTGSSRLAGLLRLSNPTRHRVLIGGIDCEVVTATIG